MKRAAAVVALVTWSACSFQPGAVTRECASDLDCAAPQVCFVDGCGDPGQGVAVEALANSQTGYHAQDLSLAGKLTGSVDFSLTGPLTLSGEFRRDGAAPKDLVLHSAYTDSVTIRAVGESEIIPGIYRTYEGRFAAPERGAFTMPVGAGKFTVTAIPADRSVPQETRSDVSIKPGEKAPTIEFDFAPLTETVSLSGRLVRRVISEVPRLESPVTQASMEIQAFNALTLEPISQAAPVSSGLSGSTGDFALVLSPSAASLESVLLTASPKDPTAMVPSKSFVVQRPFPSPLTLELGDFGEPLRQVGGVVKNSAGKPLANATVLFEGLVGGGGLFRSKRVTTDSEGRFAVDLLANLPGETYTATVWPLPASGAGLLRTKVSASAHGGMTAVLEPSVFITPDPLDVRGVVTTPEGLPRGNAVVTATPVDVAGARLLPITRVVTVTNQDGQFDLKLDPAVYQIDVEPGGEYPRRGRRIRVEPTVNADDSVPVIIELPDFQLSHGRTMSGTVSIVNGAVSQPAANAALNFWRVATMEGKPTPVLLGEAVTDGLGGYTVVLPTR